MAAVGAAIGGHDTVPQDYSRMAPCRPEFAKNTNEPAKFATKFVHY